MICMEIAESDLLGDSGARSTWRWSSVVYLEMAERDLLEDDRA